VKYTKHIVKMGDRSTYPMKGDMMEYFYTMQGCQGYSTIYNCLVSV